jgi:hypothetical protein
MELEANNSSTSTYDRIAEVKAFEESKAGVKGLLESGICMTKIPHMFHSPKLNLNSTQESDSSSKFSVPIIDLQDINTNPSIHVEVVDKIRSASKEWGFFQVINHGAPLESRQKIESVGKKFFGQKMEEKKKVRRDIVNVMGYYETEHTKNVRDWKEVFDFTLEEPTLVPASIDPHDKEITHWYNQWPEFPPEMR